MAALPMSDQQQPDAGASPDQGGAAPQDGGAQASQLQETIGKLMHLTLILGSQNAVIQPEMQEAATAYRKAFLKTVQAAQPPQQQTPAPPGQ